LSSMETDPACGASGRLSGFCATRHSHAGQPSCGNFRDQARIDVQIGGDIVGYGHGSAWSVSQWIAGRGTGRHPRRPSALRNVELSPRPIRTQKNRLSAIHGVRVVFRPGSLHTHRTRPPPVAPWDGSISSGAKLNRFLGGIRARVIRIEVEHVRAKCRRKFRV